MVNIGLLGDVSAGKTSILRLFVKYLNKGDIEKVEGGKKCTVLKTDFSGEATVPTGNKEDSLNEKETKTIHPNRVVFRETDSGKAHTIFAPGGDRKRSVIRMGIITISRIVSHIIAVFSLDRELEEQFDFFNDIRFFPDKIYVCINKIDLIKDSNNLEKIKEQISAFFNIRKIKIIDFFITCAEEIMTFEDIQEFNNNVAKMILNIISK